MSWKDKVRDPHCQMCSLSEHAEHVCLMGAGSRKSKIMIVGEAPGQREDEQHAAFVGPAGQLLTELLGEVGIVRDECYITNAVKCRPSGNATPSRAEAKVCSNTYLTQEISRVQPEFILAVGNSALQVTTGRSGITKYRGKTFACRLGGDAIVLPTFHPAAALRSPKYLPAIKADFQAFARLVTGMAGSNGSKTRVRIIRTPAQFRWLIRELRAASEIVIDLETDGLEEWQPGVEILTIGFSWRVGEAAVIPLFHPESPWSEDQCRAILKILNKVLSVFDNHNIKFDARWFAASGVFLKGGFDTMLAAHCLDENRPKALEYLCQILLSADSWKISSEDKSNLRAYPLKKLCIYNGEDTDNTLRLKHLLKRQLKDEPRVERIFYELMMPASDALTRIEAHGIWVDPEKLDTAAHRTEEILGKLVTMMNKYLPKGKQTINYNSPQQVAEWLFNDLGLPIVKRTKTKAPSTAEGVLFELQDSHKAVKALLKYRKWHKYFTTYLGPWSRTDGRGYLHPNYLLHGTTTFRLSSRGPNLQQVPRDPFMRGCFGAPPGWKFVEADYSQVELRIVAMLAHETNMLRALQQGKDLHYETAERILRVPRDQVTTDDRVIWGKHPNFGLCFGMGPGTDEKSKAHDSGYFSYCKDNGHPVSDEEAEFAYSRYHEAYPRIRKWHDRQKRLARRYGRVQSATGRIRHLPDMQSSDNSVRAEAERQAINFPAQSLASDFMLVSLVRLEGSLPNRMARIVGTIHDALLFMVRDEAVDVICPQIKETMEDMAYLEKKFGAQITVPIEAEVKVGQHWGETKLWVPN